VAIQFTLAAQEATLNTLYVPDTEHDACGIGFTAQIDGTPSHRIVSDALDVLERLAHRGGSGVDPQTGDGAGIMVQIPHDFLASRLDFSLPKPGRYGVGQVFLPANAAARAVCEAALERAIEQEGQVLLGWRDVPVDSTVPGKAARANMPVIRQLFVRQRRVAPSAFERKLYVIRKLAENHVDHEQLAPDSDFHVCSLSSRTVVYKGMLTSEQLRPFYADLRDDAFASAVAVVHSRFSTNTLPTWDRAQPCRLICHNGEINTLRGNRNWMRARHALLENKGLGGSLDRLLPIVRAEGSDSAQFDNMVEVLHLAGRSLHHAMMLMIPEAWENQPTMDPERRAFYRYASAVMEPWDGPAAICFTDGTLVGATLDRNGLRPARYTVTTDGRVVLASEVGVLDIDPADVVRHGRLQPGRMLLVDTVAGVILDDEQAKQEITRRAPWERWLAYNEMRLRDLPPVAPPACVQGRELVTLQRAHGWTDEDERLLVGHMAETGKEPIAAMGNDTPLAVLSNRAPSLFNYFRQLFAQVTNPPIDPIRERLVMSVGTSIGGGGNPFDDTAEQCHRLTIDHPVLTNADLAKMLASDVLETVVLSTVYAPGPPDALKSALELLCEAASDAVDDGCDAIVLSDRGVDARHVPMPALLATSAIHQRLVREGTRLLTGLVVSSAEIREVHHVACLLGFGAGSVNPWLLLDTTQALSRRDAVDVDAPTAESNAVDALHKGLLKVMSKMGISTLASYCGSQIFECVGLERALIDEHFTGTVSRLGGIGLDWLDAEAQTRHQRGFESTDEALPVGGLYQWRPDGAVHKWRPETIAALQKAVKTDDRTAWELYRRLAGEEDDVLITLRGMLDFVDGVEVAKAEPASAILTRFVTGAMSFGSLSAPAHETLAIAMNRLGGRSNSGEGGEEPERFTPSPNGDSRRSAIKQVASGRFGVTTHYLVEADDLQIKISQGAKPGEGGQLPGHKVSERIAAVRCSTPGVTLISPPPHHDIYSIEDLAQLIWDLKMVNPRARVSVKLVSEVGVGTVAAGVVKAGADCVIIAGSSGGTGASPKSSIQHAGLPWELGLAETQQVLVQNGLRSRVRVQVDGGMRTARDMVVAALLGADEIGVATAALIAMGCIMLRKCHANTCSVGVATQDPALTERFTGTPEQVERLFTWLSEDVRARMMRLGFSRFQDMVGRADHLVIRSDLPSEKAKCLDLRPLLASTGGGGSEHRVMPPPLAALDGRILSSAPGLLRDGEKVRLDLPINNTDRTVGARLSGVVAAQRGSAGLAAGQVEVAFTGAAGQSFGAFLVRGIHFTLHGEANDYLAKGLSGGRVAVRPPAGARYTPEDNIAAGNVVLYGATSGEVFINGRAGERFAVRNSGARAVVEGLGDHGCEYMTGGVVMVLGTTGRNFAAGMSGGMAYVFDKDGKFRSRCNTEMVDLEPLVEEADLWLVQRLIEDHLRYTSSPLAERILDHWEHMVPRFVKVMPTEYRRVLQARRAKRRRRLVKDMLDPANGSQQEVANG
jgi:glutamate synthase (NADPH) large chain